MSRTFTKYPNRCVTASKYNYKWTFGALSRDEVDQIEAEVSQMSNEDLLRAYAKHWFDFNAPGTSTREDDVAEIYYAEILARMK